MAWATSDNAPSASTVSAPCTPRHAAHTTAKKLSATSARPQPQQAAVGAPHGWIAACKYASSCCKAVASVQRLRDRAATRLSDPRRGQWGSLGTIVAPSRVACFNVLRTRRTPCAWPCSATPVTRW
jgi:hypothetical protein